MKASCGADAARIASESGAVEIEQMNSTEWSGRALGTWRVALAALVLSLAPSQRARAFGGFWSSHETPVRQAGLEVIFVDNPDSTITSIVRIKYAGAAQKFAWLIPVPGAPTVAVSSNTVFERLNAATAPQYWLEQAAPRDCVRDGAGDMGVTDAMRNPSDAGTASGRADAPTSVAPIDRGTVGPYDYVTLTLDAADPVEAATDWLSTNGYDLTDLDSEVLRPYLEAGLNLLAFKLNSDAEAGAIRPVVLTYESELPSIPIRAAAVSSQSDMGVHVWVFGASQAVPDNFKALVLNDAVIDWLTAEKYVAGTLPSGGVGPFGDHAREPTNYDAVVAAAADEAGGQGFVTELGAPASQFRERVWSALDGQQLPNLMGRDYADGVDALLAAAELYAGWDGFRDAVQGATSLPDGVTFDAFEREPARYRERVEIDTAAFFRLLEEGVIKPTADTAALFYNAPYLTRLYSVMSADDMTRDPAFIYNADLAQISNTHIAAQTLECSPTQGDAAWRIELPQGGVVSSEAGGGWPVALGSMPANLKVVMLSTRGSGTVVEDNREVIWQTLDAATGASGGAERPDRTYNGVLIGGSQSVRPFEASDAPRAPTRADDPKLTDAACSVQRPGAERDHALALWFALALAALAWRRRSAPWANHSHGHSSAMKRRAMARLLWAVGLAAGCSGDERRPAQEDSSAPYVSGPMTAEQLRDPESCKSCHPIHYREWSGSMHAYAAKDPVFHAMNQRGQRETGGQLGDFCVKCHAPMAVADGLTTDGLNLDELADKERGVSCYFCHNVVDVEGDHNGNLRVANDDIMRGPIRDPFPHSAHQAEYSGLFEPTDPKSSAMCGGCHDIVTPAGVHLERTFKEYRTGLFSKSATGEPPPFDGCVGCHMSGEKGFAAVAPAGVGERLVHEHLWPGVDVPLIDFPHREAMRSAVEDCQLGVASVAWFTLEVTPPDLFTFQVETSAGHNQPSGSAQDRRMWLEFLAYDASGALLEEVSSGNIADGELEEKPKGDPKHDPNLLMFRDRIYDEDGKPVHMFWQAAKSEAYPDGYESNLLPVASTTYVEGKRAVVKQYRATGPDGQLPARVTARLRIRPIGMDVLEDLVESGDLDRAIVDEMPTLSFGAQIEWTPERGVMKPIAADVKTDCGTYRCLLDPSSNKCD
jgi:Uncharacterized protein conserved in bacteria (DUF2330)/Cytochrome c554 and c-prime